jgi:hypothetical protein
MARSRKRPRRKTGTDHLPLPVRLLAWLASGLSFLNLIRDANLIELYGHLRTWTNAYDRLVHTLFGWIDFGPIGINRWESHVILLSFVVSGAISRAVFKKATRDGKPNALSNALFYAILIPTMFVVWLLFPDPLGLIICVPVLLLLVVSWSFAPDDDEASGADFRRELLGAGAALAIVLLLNYTLFKSAN